MMLRRSFDRNGYCVLRDAIDRTHCDEFETKILALLQTLSGRSFKSTRDPAFASFLASNRDVEQQLYDDVRRHDWVLEFSCLPGICQPVAELLGAPIGLMSKLPVRIDLPNVTRELAVWHQDFFYVKGNPDIITAWIPLQDTRYINGCLMVMPGSHCLGPIDHDLSAIGKRHCPSNIYDREVRYVEMARGDVLLFHSLLLHSSGLNLSDVARLSLQPRYSRLSEPTDPAMGRVIAAA